MPYTKKKIFYIGGDDVNLRIPIIKLLDKNGFDISAIGAGEKPKEKFENSNIKYFKYDLDRGYNIFADINTIFEIYGILKDEKPDIVQTFSTKPTILGSVAAWFAGVPKIIRTINGMGRIFSFESKKNYFLRKAYHFLHWVLSKITHTTIFQNKDDFKYFKKKRLVEDNKLLYVAGSGVSIEDLENSIVDDASLEKLKHNLNTKDKCVVLLISRMLQSKGVIEYLESAKKITKNSNEIKFLLVGPKEVGEERVDLSVINQYEEVCTYLGYRSDASSIMQISDIVVLPSYYKEGVPRVLIEGAALGKPIISTDVNGCRDIAVHNENGIIVPIKDSNKLSNAILLLANDKEKRIQMGKKGKILVSKSFSLERVCEGWMSVYV